MTQKSTATAAKKMTTTPKINRLFRSLSAMQRTIRNYFWEEILSLRSIRLLQQEDAAAYATTYNELVSLFPLEDQITIGIIFDEDKSDGYRNLTYSIFSTFLHHLEHVEGFRNPISSVRSFEKVASGFMIQTETSKHARPMTSDEFYQAILLEWQRSEGTLA